MPHTTQNFAQDRGFSDGILIVGPEDIMVSGTGTRTRNAAGDWSINQGASLTVNFALNIGQMIQRTGYALGSKLHQEQFGGSQADPLANGGGVYGVDYTGAPDSARLPRTTPVPKGIKIKGFNLVYLITGAALTAHTCRVDKVTYANNVAVAIAASLASGANGLATATQANPYVTQVLFAAGEQIYRATDLQELILEITATTQAGGAYRLYRIELLVEFNFN